MPKNIGTVPIATAADLIAASEALCNSWFRGESDPERKLESSLERDAKQFNVPTAALPEREQAMLRLFEQRAHLYIKPEEQPRSDLERYSLIRHYGGPSRLLDITRSCLVATYFALANSQPKRDAVVWVFRETAIGGQRQVDVDEQFRTPAKPGVIIAKPDRLNIRINAQCGAFFVPGRVEKSLQEQIGITFDTDFNAKISRYRSVSQVSKQIHHRVWKPVISRPAHSEIFRFLSRCNIRGYTLFPGAEGLASSLRELMRAYD